MSGSRFMIRTVSFAALVLALGVSAAQACPFSCGAPAPVVVAQPVVEIERPVLPPHYIVEHGPLYDGLGVFARPRVYKPRTATFVSYPYVRHHRRPLRV